MDLRSPSKPSEVPILGASDLPAEIPVEAASLAAGVSAVVLREKLRYGRLRGRRILDPLLGRETWRVSVEDLRKLYPRADFARASKYFEAPSEPFETSPKPSDDGRRPAAVGEADQDFLGLLDALEAEREARTRAEAKVETLELLEQGAQRYADRLEGLLKEKDRSIASLARALGAAEKERDLLGERVKLLTEGRPRGLRRFLPWGRGR